MKLSLAEIISKYQLDLIVLFGSKARGQLRPDSDIDLAVRSSHVLTPQQKLDLAFELDSHYPQVDLVDIRKASPLLLGAIAQDAQLIFEESSGAFEEFKLFAYNQYMDFKPILEKQRLDRLRELETL